MSKANLPTFSAANVATHNSFADCWVSRQGKVYDITRFIYEHPGGDSVLVKYAAGRDVEELMAGRDGGEHEHSDSAYTILEDYQVGILEATAEELDLDELKATLRDLRTESDIAPLAAKLGNFGEDGARLLESLNSVKSLFHEVVTESHKEALTIAQYAQNSSPESPIRSHAQTMRTRLSSLRNALLRLTGEVTGWGDTLEADKQQRIATRRYHLRTLGGAGAGGGSGLETTLYAVLAATIAGAVAATTGPLASVVPPPPGGISVPVAGLVLVAIELLSLGGVLNAKNNQNKERAGKEKDIAQLQREITVNSETRAQLVREVDAALSAARVLNKLWTAVQSNAGTPETISSYMQEYVGVVGKEL